MLEDKAAAGIHPKYIPPRFEPGLRAPLAKASYTFQARTLTKLRGGAVRDPPSTLRRPCHQENPHQPALRIFLLKNFE